MYIEGSRIGRSSKAVKSTLTEGYERGNYKQDYLNFITSPVRSNYETIDHLETQYETKSLTDEKIYNSLKEMPDKLGGKLNKYIQVVEQDHKSKK